MSGATRGLRPPDAAALRDAVARALAEDRASQDVTTLATVPPGQSGRGSLLIKQDGVLSGLDLVREVYRQLGGGVHAVQVDMVERERAATGDRTLVFQHQLVGGAGDRLGNPQSPRHALGERRLAGAEGSLQRDYGTVPGGQPALQAAREPRPRRDGLYVLHRPGDISIRRLQLGPQGDATTIIADNPKYPPIPNTPLSTLDIIGLVLWRGHAL